nr:L-histidine N(alpha)-methyltransferase [Desulfobulbaceae bacterium]
MYYNNFALDICEGLKSSEKNFPVKYLYDSTGSSIFEKITKNKDYYLAHCELNILAENADEIVAHIHQGSVLIELGSGCAEKTRSLLDALIKKQGKSLFVPVDIAGEYLRENIKKLKADYPELVIQGVVADYHKGIKEITSNISEPKFILWLGSDIGHLPHQQAAEFIKNFIVDFMSDDDYILLGIDLKKDTDVIESAYGHQPNSPIHKLSSNLALNGLARINNQLGGNFDLSLFQYHCKYNIGTGSIDIALQSLCHQIVYLSEVDLTVSFAKDELIRVHSSYKYSVQDIEQLASTCGLKILDQWFDKGFLYSVSLFKRAHPS